MPAAPGSGFSSTSACPSRERTSSTAGLSASVVQISTRVTGVLSGALRVSPSREPVVDELGQRAAGQPLAPAGVEDAHRDVLRVDPLAGREARVDADRRVDLARERLGHLREAPGDAEDQEQHAARPG